MDDLTRHFIATSRSLSYLMHEDKDKQDRERQETESSPSHTDTGIIEAPMNTSKTRTSKDQTKQDIETTLKKIKDSFLERLQDPKFILELAGFAVLAVYAGYTIAMYYANRDSADAATSAAETATDTLIAGNRAWVRLTLAPPWSDPNIPFIKALKTTDKYVFRAVVENIGKSPATGLIIDPVVHVFGHDEIPHFTYEGFRPALGEGLLYPTQRDESIYFFLPDLSNPPVIGMMKISPTERAELEQSTKYILIYGRARYSDEFADYGFQFCFMMLANESKFYNSPALKACLSYNTVLTLQRHQKKK